MNEDIQTGTGNDDLKTEMVARFKLCDRYYDKWDKVAKEDYRFALGDQWEDEDRNALKDQARPCLTFNRIKPMISLVSGYQRENSARIKVNPEGGEDKLFSDVVDRIISQIDKWSHMTYKLSYQFDDGLYCGKGFLEAMITYDSDPIRGEVKFKQCSPYQILVDPDCLEYDMNEGARYLFKKTRLSREQIKDLYPSKKKLIDGFIKDNDDDLENGRGLFEGTNDDYHNRPNRTTVTTKARQVEEDPDLEKDMKFTLKEYWYKKRVKKYYVINLESGEPEKFDSKEEAEAFITTQINNPEVLSMKVIDREVDEMWVSVMVCGHILQNEKSPFEPYYSGYPFFRFIADWAPNAESEELRVQGITRPVKDPQREKNKSKSQNLHILNTQANSGWIADDDALSREGFEQLEQMGSKPGLVIKKRAGKELREILPKGPNAGHLQREQQADEEFKQISGINPDLMGMKESTASGKAIGLRIKQAILSLVRLFVNYRYTKEILGMFLLKMIPMLFDSKKVMKVLGPSFLMKSVDPMKYPEGLNEGHIQAFLQMIKDSKYDILITESDHNATLRFETFNQLVELIKSGMPIPPDLVIDYMDLPNSEEVKQKIAQMQQQQQMLAQMGAPAAG